MKRPSDAPLERAVMIFCGKSSMFKCLCAVVVFATLGAIGFTVLHGRPVRAAATASVTVPRIASSSGVHPPFSGVHRGGLAPSRFAAADFAARSWSVHSFAT